ncbi:MAG: NAD-dependent epimerase/dehydratase family protein [Mycobacteriales bacterium]
MKVLVIGGSGFIGTRLVGALLEAGHGAQILDLRMSASYPEITTIGDVTDRAAVEAALSGIDVAVNLAAEHRDDVRPVSRYDAVNVGGAHALVAAAEASGVDRLVFTSTVAVYGLGRPRPDESAPTAPFNDYGRTKLEAEHVLSAWAARDPGRALTIVRPCVVFGEGNRGNVWTLATQVATGRFRFVGDGANKKSMAYVGNVAAYLARAVDAGPGVHLSNYADGPDLTTRELVAVMTEHLGVRVGTRPIPLSLGILAGGAFDVAARLTGRSFPVSAVRVRKFAAETTVDAGAVDRSGFVRPYDIVAGLRRTLAAEFPGDVR